MVIIFYFFDLSLVYLFRLQTEGIVIHFHLVKFDFRIQLRAGI